MKDEKQNGVTNEENEGVDLNSNFLFDQVDEEKRKAMAERIEKEWKPKNVHYPEYWKKRLKKLNPEIKKLLEKTANTKPIACDDYGFYAPGYYLHRCFIVTVKHEDGLWSLHVFGEQPITMPIVEEVRYRFLPDDLTMAQLWQSRSEQGALKGVVLYELPESL